MSARLKPFLPWLLVAAVLAIYWPAAQFGFINMDDDVYVTANPHVLGGLTWENVVWAFNGIHAGFWHPLTWLSLQLDATVFGSGPAGFHCTNVLLHALNAVLVWLFLRKLTGSHWRSALVAALFALHPLRVEAVAWVSGRKELLAVTFVLASLYSYAASQTSEVAGVKRKHLLLALVWFACALLSKPMAVTLPVLLLLLDLWPLNRATDRKPATWWPLLREKIPFFTLALGAALLAMQGNFHTTGKAGENLTTVFEHPLPVRLQNAACVPVVYLLDTLRPKHLAAVYPFPPTITMGLVTSFGAILVGITALVWRARCKAWLVGWLWFLVALLPVSGIIQVGPHAHADRYTYLPAIGLTFMFAWGISDFAARWKANTAWGWIAGINIFGLALGAGAQLMHWRDSGTLFTHAVKVTYQNYFAEALLGNYLTEQGDPAGAAPHFAKAVEWRPDYTDAWNGLGQAELALGRKAQAEEHFQKTLQLNPGHAGALNNLGLLAGAAGRTDEAIAYYRRAVEANPNEATAWNNLGFALTGQGKLPEAIEACGRAVSLRPANAAFVVNYASALGKSGRMPEAVTQYREALRLDPNLTEVREFLRQVDGGK